VAFVPLDAQPHHATARGAVLLVFLRHRNCPMCLSTVEETRKPTLSTKVQL